MDKVLLIDDDKFVRKIINRQLKDHFIVTDAVDGKHGIGLLDEIQPNIILLDIEMPGLNGYEVCDRIRQSGYRQTPIIILSSHSSLRERMLGYEAGADDYLQKPCEADELLAKIAKLINNNHDKAKLKQQAVEAQQTAMIALTSSNELGLAMMFAEQCIQCSDIQQLANKIFAFAAKLNLKTSLMMQFSFQSHFIHSDGDDKPLVNQLMPRLNQDRIVDFGSRTQINYERISILVRNMPIEDRNRYGRIKDILPPVLATANAKIQLLDAAHSISEQVTHLETTVATLNNNFLNLDSLNQQHHDRAFTHLHDMLWSTTQTLGSLGLEQDQEEAILNQIEQAILKTKSTLCEQNAFIAYLQNTNETVTTITKEFSKIKQLFESQKKLDEEINEDLNDIELF